MTSPLVGILPHREVKAYSGVQETLPRVYGVPLDEALATRWNTDAHFLLYHLVDRASGEVLEHDGRPGWFRIRKIALPKLRADGCDVRVGALAFDYDNPGHAAWVPSQYEEFVALVLSFADKEWRLPSQFTSFYATKGGARFVYALKRPLEPEEAEGIARGVIRDFGTVGIKLDDSCADWTRCFRLPSVVREDRPTWEQPYFDVSIEPSQVLDASTISPEVRHAHERSMYVEPLDAPKPSPEECEALLYEEGKNGHRKQTDWHTRAKKKPLVGRPSYAVAFEHAPIGEQGSRMNNLQRLVGEAVGMLFPLEGSSPAHVYALFRPAAEQLEPDASVPDWTEETWAAVVRYWALEEGKALARRQEEEAKAATATRKMEAIVEGMSLWCPRPEIHRADPEESAEWARKHLIVMTGQTFHVVDARGEVDAMAVNANQLHARIRELGMDDIIPTHRMTEQGRMVQVPVSEILARHGTNVGRIEGCVDIDYNMVENIETAHATFRFRLYRRKRDLIPEYSKDVADWLRSWFPDDEDLQRMEEWISHALAFEEGPICAISLSGPPGCGKKVFVTALAECVEGEAIADDKDFGNFQSMITRSGILAINEGLSKNGTSGARDIADVFRHYVSGDPITCNPKYRDPYVVRNPLRVVITANNPDVLLQLAGHRDLSPDDRAAITTRILHLQIDSEASNWLRRRGGKEFTARPGRRWIRSDAGAPSDYVVARHFLWLHANRGKVPFGNRLLVEGRVSEEMLLRMTTQSGTAPYVVEAICAMIEKGTTVDGFHMTNNGIFVTPHAVVEYAAMFLRKTGINITIQAASSVLRSIGPTRDLTTFKNQTAKWVRIDVHMLLATAIEHGLKCSKLKQYVDGQIGAEVRRS